MKYTLLTILFLLVLAPVAVTIWYQSQMQPASAVVSRTYIDVEEGMTARDVARKLHEEELIRSQWAFYMYLMANDAAHQLQAGFYRFSPTQPPTTIASALTRGEVNNQHVRIPSGIDLEEVASILEDSGFGETEVEQALNRNYDVDILNHKPADESLEGYLYPDTYAIARNSDPQELVKMIIVHTQQQVTLQIQEQWEEQGLSVHEGLTLASIVQQEVADAQERKQVAQVFLSRLERDMPLEADPTFQYAARKQGIEATPDIDSPYNTYQTQGLPPGPIGTVTRSALEAVAEPADTDYLYFVTGEDGETRFSRDKQQHQRYIDKHGVSGN